MEKVVGTKKVAGRNGGIVPYEMGTEENIKGKSSIFTFSLCDITQIVQYHTRWV